MKSFDSCQQANGRMSMFDWGEGSSVMWLIGSQLVPAKNHRKKHSRINLTFSPVPLFVFVVSFTHRFRKQKGQLLNNLGPKNERAWIWTSFSHQEQTAHQPLLLLTKLYLLLGSHMRRSFIVPVSNWFLWDRSIDWNYLTNIDIYRYIFRICLEVCWKKRSFLFVNSKIKCLLLPLFWMS